MAGFGVCLEQNLENLLMDWMWGEKRYSQTAQKLAQLGPDWPLEVNNVLPCPGPEKSGPGRKCVCM